jgi:hypothetical protein
LSPYWDINRDSGKRTKKKHKSFGPKNFTVWRMRIV